MLSLHCVRNLPSRPTANILSVFLFVKQCGKSKIHKKTKNNIFLLRQNTAYFKFLRFPCKKPDILEWSELCPNKKMSSRLWLFALMETSRISQTHYSWLWSHQINQSHSKQTTTHLLLKYDGLNRLVHFETYACWTSSVSVSSSLENLEYGTNMFNI